MKRNLDTFTVLTPVYRGYFTTLCVLGTNTTPTPKLLFHIFSTLLSDGSQLILDTVQWQGHIVTTGRTRKHRSTACTHHGACATPCHEWHHTIQQFRWQESGSLTFRVELSVQPFKDADNYHLKLVHLASNLIGRKKFCSNDKKMTSNTNFKRARQ